ncbi:MAG: nucleotidyltransferase family protein [Pseudomonadota bacterium]|nr:nucleotidyltransferase family protein [Pseudomonadota bacterium]
MHLSPGNLDHSGPLDAPVIVLLAAGASRRYGTPKQLAMVDGEPMLRRVTRIVLGAGVPVIVVVGSQADLVMKSLEALPVQIALCEDWSEGMGNSLAAGARAVQQCFPQASGVLLCLADQPLVKAAMLTRLLQRHQQVPLEILASEYQQALGPPIMFPRDCLAELTRWSGEDGARVLLQRESHRVERCPTASGIDVDTPEALDHINVLLAGNRP